MSESYDDPLDNLSDEEFLHLFFQHDTEAHLMDELDQRLKREDFRQYFEQVMDARYRRSTLRIFMDYLPAVILILLIIAGLILILR